MRPGFIFFVVVFILGFVGGYFYHEAQDEKVRYERDLCYDFMNSYHIQTKYVYDVNKTDLNISGVNYERR